MHALVEKTWRRFVLYPLLLFRYPFYQPLKRLNRSTPARLKERPRRGISILPPFEIYFHANSNDVEVHNLRGTRIESKDEKPWHGRTVGPRTGICSGLFHFFPRLEAFIGSFALRVGRWIVPGS